MLGLTGLPLAAAPSITEFMATGSEAPRDVHGNTPDWMEIHNPNGAGVKLAGYALTDDREILKKWVFPDVSLEAGAYLIVFASGADRAEAGGELHANFQLNGGGEYLALVDPEGAVVSEFTFPEQFGNVSYGTFGEELNFFKTPTPGSANGKGLLGFVADTKFTVDRGFYDESFDLEITTETEGADIFYSTDGSDPAKGTLFSPAKRYLGPLSVETTTVVRAMAKKPGWQSTNTDTHTYIFHDDVVKQPSRPEGFPERWNRDGVDYEMDPDIVEPNADKMRDSLRSLPTLSFVGKVEDFFGSEGIYGNPQSTGVEWERPISFEWLNEDGTGKFQVDCGARIQGGYFRQASATEKHSFRLLFKAKYGVERLRQEIIDLPGAASDFDTIVFRAGANDGYSWGAAGTTVQFTRDEFGRRLAYGAGHASPRGGFQHLYINGLYWGLYNLTERPNEDFSATYYGGDPADWDAVNSGEVKNAGGRENGKDPTNSGSREWRAFETAARGAKSYEDYMALQGLNPDGTRNPDLEVYLDADHYVDYMIINLWAGNWDWPNKNFWFGRLNTAESTGFKFYVWDFENTMGNNRGRSPLSMNAPRNTDGVGQPYASLKDLLWFQIKWADRTQRMFFNGGILAPEKLMERYRAMADGLELAIYAETARWGDDNSGRPHTIAEWRNERDWLLETYLPRRTDIVLEQFKDADLFPEKSAPVLAQHGGAVSSGYEATFEGSTASLFYTVDGSDPFTISRSGSIGLSEQARAYENPIPIPRTTTIKARYYIRGIFGGVRWSPLTEATFTLGTDDLVVSDLLYNPAKPTEEERAQGWTSGSQFEYLVMMNTGASEADLKGVRFLSGIDFDFSAGSITTLGPGESVIIVRNRGAFESRYGLGHPVAGEYGGRLDDDGETVRLADAGGNVIYEFRYDDVEPWPLKADGEGATLALTDPAARPDPNKGESWVEGTPLQGKGGDENDPWLMAASDEDGDGLAKIFEYAFGSDPKAFDSNLTPRMTLSHEEGKPRPTLTYRRDRSAAGVRIVVEVSRDLESWEPIAPTEWETREESLSGGDPDHLLVRVSQIRIGGEPVRYIRLAALPD